MDDHIAGIEFRRWTLLVLVGVYQIALHLVPLVCVLLSIHYWNDFTSCFQREVFILNSLVLYWRFAKKQYGGMIFWEITQLTILFWIAQTYNLNEVEIDPYCLDTDGYIALTLIHLSFLSLLYALTVVGIIFIVFFVGFVIYVAIDETILVPRRRREMGLNDEQFSKLKEITYAAPPMTNSRSGVLECSICLTEFIDQDKLTELPNCAHKFHTKCIREWLKENRICPYCRSDVKNNLGIDELSEQGIDPPEIAEQGPGDNENPLSLSASFSGLEQNSVDSAGFRSRRSSLQQH